MAARTSSGKSASKRTLNAANLKGLGASRLAELLLELAADDANAKRRLRLELAARESPAAVARLARTRLGALRKGKSPIAAKRMPAVLEDLKAHHRAILGTAVKEKPALGLELMWLLVGAAASVRERRSMDPGVWELAEEATNQLGEVARAAKADPETLAEEITATLVEDQWGAAESIPVLAPTLGKAGLAHLKRRMRDESLFRHTRQAALLRIADAEGDVDSFIRLHSAEERKLRRNAAAFARRLCAADRTEEALEALDAAEDRPDPDDYLTDEPPFAWEDARIAALDALGRHDEAQEMRWSVFETTLSAPHLRAWLGRFPEFDDIEAEERAFDHAARFPDATQALEFFVSWPDPGRAAALVLRRAKALDGEQDRILDPAAEALAARHPLAATLVLRSMIEFTLSGSHRDRYKHAARCLAACSGLAPAIAGFRGHPDHGAYVAWLRKKHPYQFDF